MEKSKIFIASSSKASMLATKMRDELSNVDYAEADVWSELSRDYSSSTIIEMLEHAARSFDFAVIMLTLDDLFIKEGTDQQKSIARDNCLFEAGLLMGTLGRERCFLVTDIKSADLPSDLQGITYMPIGELTSFTDPDQCKEAIAPPSSEILEIVRRRGRLERVRLVFLSFENLSGRELTTTKGGDILPNRLIVVNDNQPLENDRDVVQIKKNMDEGVKYIYFFYANEDGAMRICWFLQILLLADWFDDAKQDFKLENREKKLEEKKDEILKNLQDICDLDKLKFCFMPAETIFPLRIHNANDPGVAKLYLRVDNRRFMEWGSGEKAMNIWLYLKNYHMLPHSGGIFNSTVDFKLYKKETKPFRDVLNLELSRYFPKIHKKIKNLCYGKYMSKK